MCTHHVVYELVKQEPCKFGNMQGGKLMRLQLWLHCQVRNRLSAAMHLAAGLHAVSEQVPQPGWVLAKLMLKMTCRRSTCSRTHITGGSCGHGG